MGNKGIDKRLYRRVVQMFVELACDPTGQPINAKTLDRIMEDIIGRKDFFKSLCNVHNDYELRRIFNGVNIMDIISIIENDVQITALYEMIDLDRDMYTIKKKIKRYTKKGKKCKSLRERYSKLEKMYRKSIKNFRKLLGIQDIKKDSKPSKRYASIAKFNDMYSKGGDKYSYFSSLFMDEDDFDDDDEDYEYDPRDFLLNQRDEAEMYYARRRGNMGRAALSRDFEMDDYDDDDEDGDDECDSEEIDAIKMILEDQNDKMQKILSTMGALIAMNSNFQISERIPYQPATFVDEIMDDDDDGYEEDPLSDDQVKVADDALAGVFAQTPENGYTINPDDPGVAPTVIQKDYESMEMPELIKERNNLSEESQEGA